MMYVPYLSTLVSFLFAAAVLTRFFRRRGMHLLWWGLGLVLYGLGTLSEVILSRGFSALTLRVWYLAGAMLVAAWLGQGTVFLLVRKRKVAWTLAVLVLAASALSTYLVFTAPLVPEGVAAFRPDVPVSAQYKDILTRSGLTIALTVLLNLYGTITLVGGALYSAYLFWRKQVLANRMYGNILIAAGALMPAMGGTFLKVGLGDWLYVSELLGAVLMFLGYRLAVSEPQSAVQSVAEQV